MRGEYKQKPKRNKRLGSASPKKRKEVKPRPEPIPTRLADKVKKSCGTPPRLVKTGSTSRKLYTLMINQISDSGTTQYDVKTPNAMHETRNKVVVLYETENGGGSQHTLNLTANYMLGVTHEDDFSFELPRLKAPPYLVAFPRLQDSPVQFNVLVIVVGKVRTAEDAYNQQLVNELRSTGKIERVDCFLAVFDDESYALDESHVAVPVSADQPLQLVLAPRRLIAEASQALWLALAHRPVPVTKSDYADNQSTYKSLFDRLAAVNKDLLVCSPVVTKERMQLEEHMVAANQTVRDTLKNLSEVRQDRKIMKKHEAEVQAGTAFEETYEVAEVVMVTQDKINTYCLQCKVVCHEECKIDNDGEKFKCAAMKAADDDEDDRDAYCIRGKCVGKECRWVHHRNMPEIEKTVKIPVKCSSTELAQKYDCDDDLKKLNSYLQEHHEEQLTVLLSGVNKSRRAFNRLSEIASQERKNVTLLESIYKEIQNELSKKTEGCTDRVHSLLEASGKALDLIKQVSNKKPHELVPLNRNSAELQSYLQSTFESETVDTDDEIKAFAEMLVKNVTVVLYEVYEDANLIDHALDKKLDEATVDIETLTAPIPEVQLGLTDLHDIYEVEFTYAKNDLVRAVKINLRKKTVTESRRKEEELAKTIMRRMAPRSTAATGLVDEVESFFIDHPEIVRPRKLTTKEKLQKWREINSRFNMATPRANTVRQSMSGLSLHDDD